MIARSFLKMGATFSRPPVVIKWVELSLTVQCCSRGWGRLGPNLQDFPSNIWVFSVVDNPPLRPPTTTKLSLITVPVAKDTLLRKSRRLERLWVKIQFQRRELFPVLEVCESKASVRDVVLVVTAPTQEDGGVGGVGEGEKTSSQSIHCTCLLGIDWQWVVIQIWSWNTNRFLFSSKNYKLFPKFVNLIISECPSDPSPGPKKMDISFVSGEKKERIRRTLE